MHLYQELGRLLRSPTLNCEIEIPTSAKTGQKWGTRLLQFALEEQKTGRGESPRPVL